MNRRSFAYALMALWLVFGLALAPATAQAGQLDDAKAAGWVGERPDGYLGVVPGAPAGAQALAGDINARRKAKYQDIAGAQGTSLQAVEVVAGEKLVRRAKPGEYVMTPSGQWVRK